MKLASVEIRNFRAVQEMTLLLHPQLTVLHGENGLGKTSVLRAIAVGLNAAAAFLPGHNPLPRHSGADPRRGAKPPDVTVKLETTAGLAWKCVWEGGDYWRPDEKEELSRSLARIYEADRSEKKPLDLPLMAFYNTERTTLESPKKSRGLAKGEEFHRYRAFEQALAASASFPDFFHWFYAMENQELREQKARGDFDHQHRGLEGVRMAICSVLDSVSNPSVRVEPPGFEVTVRSDNGNQNLDVDQLSGGYRATLAVAADLAWRMALGNPHLEDPLSSEAVVLIDEIELHLHPSWQQRILDDLTRTFPNAQFIVTTHSPQVLTTVLPEQVVTLVREDGKIVPRAPGWGTYGAEAGDVLTVVMGVGERPRNQFSETLDQYRELVEEDQGETKEALALREKLDAWNRNDPDLVRADAAIRRRKTLRRMGRTG